MEFMLYFINNIVLLDGDSESMVKHVAYQETASFVELNNF